jgi:putative transcriptional regulator
MFEYRIDVIAELQEAGYTQYRLKKEKLMGDATLQDLRSGKIVGIKTLETICRLLDCQPGNIIRYVPDEKKVNEEKRK